MNILDDYMDSRDIQERIEELELALEDEDTDEGDRDDIQEELDGWYQVKSEVAESNPEWDDGITFIAYEKFDDYVKEFCEDCGDIPRNLPDYIVIDWQATADNLQVDYTEVEIQGSIYLFRIE